MKPKQDKDKPQVDAKGREYVIEEELVAYTRTRKLYKFVCSLPKCPYCRNVPQTARHPSKKWCSEDARAESRRRARAQKAIEKKRNPGIIGKPAAITGNTLGVFFLHLLDKPKRLDGTNVYQLGFTKSWEEYKEKYIDDPDIRKTFDRTLSFVTILPDVLAEKIAWKNEDKNVINDIFHLTDPDVRIAAQMIDEHVAAYQDQIDQIDQIDEVTENT